jgi:hypothetical protein
MSLGGILSLIGAVAAVVLSGGTALGLVAAGMMAVSAAAQFGLIGGSLGKFAQSGLFKGLTAAVTLGSAATALYGASTTGVSAAQSAQVAGDLHATVGTTIANDAGQIANDAAATNASFISSVNAGQDVAATAATAGVSAGSSGLSQAAVSALNSSSAAQGGLTSELGAAPEQAAASQTAATGAAGNTLQQGGSPLVGKPAMAPADSEAGGAPAAGTMPATPGPTMPATDANGMATATQPGIPNTNTPSAAEQPGAAAEGGGWKGMLTGALNTRGGAAAIQGVGSMLGGIGSGIAQKQATEDALKAAQWGNMQWQNSGQVAAMQAAAAKPITVPQGYLQRAQQTRALMSGNAGMQPLPAASPGAPLAPSPVHV